MKTTTCQHKHTDTEMVEAWDTDLPDYEITVCVDCGVSLETL